MSLDGYAVSPSIIVPPNSTNVTVSTTGIVTATVDADYAALAARLHDRVSATPDLTRQLIKVTKPAT